MNAFQIVIIQAGIIGKNSRQHTLDGKRAAHGSVIVVAGLKRNQQVNDVVSDIQKMLRQIGKKCRQLPDPCALEGFVIRRYAGVHGDIRTQPFGKSSSGVGTGFCQKLLVLQLSPLALDIVQRILKRDLRIRLGADKFWDHRLHGFKIQKI